MPRTLKLVIAYDGGAFHGWQAQRDLRTVQGVLQEAAQRVIRHPLALVAASRTDAGVHARGQTAHLRTESTIPVDRLRTAIEHRLPEDVAIVSAGEADDAFHATRDAIGKHYRYRIFASRRRPVQNLVQRYVWHVWYPLSLAAMAEASRSWIGRCDFAAFASAGAPRRTTVRTVSRFDVSQAGDEVVIDVEGDGFLYNQVRNMVGTLVEIGRGHWPVERAKEILLSASRSKAGPTAPPQGLCLERVFYGEAVRAADPA